MDDRCRILNILTGLSNNKFGKYALLELKNVYGQTAADCLIIGYGMISLHSEVICENQNKNAF